MIVTCILKTLLSFVLSGVGKELFLICLQKLSAKVFLSQHKQSSQTTSFYISDGSLSIIK